MRGNCRFGAGGGVGVGGTFEVCDLGAGLFCCGTGESPSFTGHIFL